MAQAWIGVYIGCGSSVAEREKANRSRLTFGLTAAACPKPGEAMFNATNTYFGMTGVGAVGFESSV
jgi:hypothetical protein